MGRDGRRSSLVLLCCATLVLLISSSAVSGVLDEKVRQRGRSAGRLKRDVKRQPLDGTRSRADGEHHARRFGDVVEVVESDEKRPEEGILEKARKFLSGAFLGAIPKPYDSVFSRPEWVPEKEEATKEEGTRFGRRHSFGHHRGSASAHWDQVRDLIRNHPEKIAAADVSSTEPLAAAEEDVTPASDFQSKIAVIVSTVLQEYHQQNSEPNMVSTCTESLELEVRSLVKRVKLALREQLCNGDVASVEEESFCNRLSDHGTWPTLEVLSKADVNPVEVAWRKMSSTAICSSVDPDSEFLESLTTMEGLAREFTAQKVLNVEHDHGHERSTFLTHRQQHGAGHRHWWHRMMFKFKHMTHHHLEDGPHERKERLHGSEEEAESSVLHREHSDHERHSRHHDEPKGESEHENKGHQKHWWRKMFAMFHGHGHMRHHRFEHGHGHDCNSRTVRHLGWGIREHLATTCRLSTDENVITACKFAKEHHFLVKAWIAVKTPLWRTAATVCAQRIESSTGSVEGRERFAPNLGRGRHPRSHPVDVEDSVGTVVTVDNTMDTVDGPQLEPLKGCARKHFLHRKFSKALHLRGPMPLIKITTRDSGAENSELGGSLRSTLLVDLGELQNAAFHGVRTREHHGSSSTQMPAADFQVLQDRLAELVTRLSQPGEDTTVMVVEPFRHHGNGVQGRRPHFRISANPDQAIPLSEGRHFRISAKPARENSDNDASVEEGVDETELTGMDGVEVEHQDNTVNHTVENRASM